MAKIITGYTGEPHVTSDDMSAFQQGVVGIEDYVLSGENEFELIPISDRKYQLPKSEVVVQGTHIRIEGDEEIEIKGTYIKRTDLVIVRYTRDSETGIESAEVDVLQGENGSTQEPSTTQNDMRNGGSVREVVLFKADIVGYNTPTITRKIPYVASLEMLTEKASENEANIDNVNVKTNENKASIDTLNRQVTNLENKRDFSGTIRAFVDNAKAAIKAWVSAYNTKGQPDVLGAGLFVQNASGKDLASIRLFSNGQAAIYKGDDGYIIPLIQNGSATITPKANETVTKQVTFSKQYASAPQVMLTVAGDRPQDSSVSIGAITASGFTINLNRSNTTSTRIDWVAFGKIG